MVEFSQINATGLGGTPRGFDLLPGCFCAKVFEAMFVGICVTTRDGTIRYMNDAFALMFNFVREEAPGRKIDEYFPGSRLLTIMEQGIVDKQVPFEWEGVKAFISRIPLYEEGVIVGGLIEVVSRDIENLQKLLHRIRTLESKAFFYKKKAQELQRAHYTFDQIVGSSKAITALRQQGAKFARTNQPILVTGESGTGKELVAHALHLASNRADECFVRVNCAAIPAELMESELFGYEDGSFTGARPGGKVGKFEMADGGTILLDEVGEIPLPMQAKLLRVLEHGEIQKIGGRTSVTTDFRVIASTNRNLEEMVRQNLFRLDLFHRLNILHLDVPPLRERSEDIPALSLHLVRNIESYNRQKIVRIEDKALEILRKHAWPGNIRELRNVLTYAVCSMEAGCTALSARHLPPNLMEKTPGFLPREQLSLQQARAFTERETIAAALRACNGNKSRAARELGVSRTELYKKLKKLALM